MNHDPLCKVANTEMPVGYVGVMIDCDCYRVRYVREDMLAKCIEAVWGSGLYDMEKEGIEEILRALKDKP